MISVWVLVMAQTYRLSGDALVLARAPTGIVVLEGDARWESWASAEALIWAGTGDEAEAEALVASIRLRHPNGWAMVEAGRLMVAGALRPAHLDGGRAVLRAPFGTTLEAFGGVPIGRTFIDRKGNWLLGGRLAQRFWRVGSVGVSVYAEADQGEAADREIGVDASLRPVRWLDLSARAAYDFLTEGLSELLFAGSTSISFVRLELYGNHRSPSRILPATSIFSVLGDVPSTRFGGKAVFHLAPRLDLSLQLGARRLERYAEDLSLRTTLRLDDLGRGVVALELRRDGTHGAEWIGLRALARVPIQQVWILSTEIELVRPEDPKRGEIWPWGLVALGYQPTDEWHLSAAVEAGASPRETYVVDALFRVGYHWEFR